MTTVCGHDRELIAGLVLDGLDDVQAVTVRTWLASCTTCREEHAELVPLPALIDLGREPGPRAPERVRDRVLADAVRRRTRRRWSTALVAAALLAGLVGVGIGRQLAPEPPEVAIAVSGVEPFEASGTVAFRTDQESTLVSVTLDGLDELPEPGVYEAWLYRADGRIVSIGQLDVIDGRAEALLTAEGPPGTYVGFWVTAEPDHRDPAHDGPTVVRATVPHF